MICSLGEWTAGLPCLDVPLLFHLFHAHLISQSSDEHTSSLISRRSGLTNYRALMKEYSFSSIMAQWLSYEDNRSLQYSIDNNGLFSYPDENYAREIMQVRGVFVGSTLACIPNF